MTSERVQQLGTPGGVLLANAIATAPASFSSLRTLRLPHCALGDAAFAALAAVLRNTILPELRELDLRGNALGAPTGRRLAPRLVTTADGVAATLRVLLLSGNPLRRGSLSTLPRPPCCDAARAAALWPPPQVRFPTPFLASPARVSSPLLNFPPYPRRLVLVRVCNHWTHAAAACVAHESDGLGRCCVRLPEASSVQVRRGGRHLRRARRGRDTPQPPRPRRLPPWRLQRHGHRQPAQVCGRPRHGGHCRQRLLHEPRGAAAGDAPLCGGAEAEHVRRDAAPVRPHFLLYCTTKRFAAGLLQSTCVETLHLCAPTCFHVVPQSDWRRG